MASIDPARVSRLRMSAQRLTGESFESPQAAVRGLVAVQSQDYAGAKWALSLRGGAADAAAEKAGIQREAKRHAAFLGETRAGVHLNPRTIRAA